MNWLAFFACVEREVRRGRSALIWLSAIGAVALLLALLRPGDTASAIAVGLAAVSSLMVLGGPSADLGSDKLHGFLEFDRVLPLSLRLVAAGRLVGAAIRMLPIAVSALAASVLIGHGLQLKSNTVLLLLLPFGALLAASMLSWILLGLNARWQFRRLWWLPITIVFGPRFVASSLPPATRRALADSGLTLLRELGALITTPLGLIVSGAVLAALPFAVFAGATLLFASGLERYRYDQNALGAVLGKAPKRELGAIGKGPVLAVARLRLRIATEQSRRQLIFLAVLLSFLFLGSPELKAFAGTYVRVLAALLPTGIAMQLSTARATGHLEGLQQLPHPYKALALGHLAAIAVLAVPGSVVLLVARAANGATLSANQGISLWGWLVAGAWIATVLALWLRWRHIAVLIGVPVALTLAGYFLLGGASMGHFFGALRTGIRVARDFAGSALPIGVATLLALLGLPLFAHGLANYQYKPR